MSRVPRDYSLWPLKRIQQVLHPAPAHLQPRATLQYYLAVSPGQRNHIENVIEVHDRRARKSEEESGVQPGFEIRGTFVINQERSNQGPYISLLTAATGESLPGYAGFAADIGNVSEATVILSAGSLRMESNPRGP